MHRKTQGSSNIIFGLVVIVAIGIAVFFLWPDATGNQSSSQATLSTQAQTAQNAPGIMQSVLNAMSPPSCEGCVLGTGDLTVLSADADPRDPATRSDPNAQTPRIIGCMDPNSHTFNPNATVPCWDCCPPRRYGCTDQHAINYDNQANTDYPGACRYAYQKKGCTHPEAPNYDPAAVIDDGSCAPIKCGCTKVESLNFDPTATVDNGSCIAYRPGCTDPKARNYNPDATVNDGGCWYPDAEVATCPNTPFKSKDCTAQCPYC